MKTFQLGGVGDRILTIKKTGGEHVAVIRVKDKPDKFIELPPKRLLFYITAEYLTFLT